MEQRENNAPTTFSSTYRVSDAHTRPRTSVFRDISGVVESEVTKETHRSRPMAKESMAVSARRPKFYDVTENPTGTVESDDDGPLIWRPAKFRVQRKIGDDVNALVLQAVVPRKARTAIPKKEKTAGSRPLLESYVPSTNSSPVSKHNKRMKPTRSKVGSSKPKRVSESSSIEAEVVEALFDLSRTITNQDSSFASGRILDSASEALSVGKQPAKVRKPDQRLDERAEAMHAEKHIVKVGKADRKLDQRTESSLDVGHSTKARRFTAATVLIPAQAVDRDHPPSVIPVSTEVPKRKKPRVRTSVEEGMSAKGQSRSSLSSKSSLELSASKNRAVVDDREILISMELDDGTSIPSQETEASSANSKHSESDHAVNNSHPTTSVDGKDPKSAPQTDAHASSDNQDSLAMLSSSPRAFPQSESIVPSADTQVSLADKSNAEISRSMPLPENAMLSEHALPREEPISEMEVEQQKVCSPCDKADLDSSSVERNPRAATDCDNEIDLLAPSRISPNGLDEIENSMNSGGLKVKEEPKDGASEKDHILVSDVSRGARDGLQVPMDFQVKDVQESSDNLACDNKQLDHFHLEKPDNNIGLLSSMTQMQSVEHGALSSVPILGQAGTWPESLSLLGHYGPAAAAAAAAAVAAAWPVPGTINSSSLKGSADVLSRSQPSRKGCSIHVFIAHFIDTQQQMRRHPIWASNNAMTHLKAYNLSMPCSDGLDRFLPTNDKGEKGSGGSEKREKTSDVELCRNENGSFCMDTRAIILPEKAQHQQHEILETQAIAPISDNHASGSCTKSGPSIISVPEATAVMGSMVADIGTSALSAQLQYMRSMIQHPGNCFPSTHSQCFSRVPQQMVQVMDPPDRTFSLPSIQRKQYEPVLGKSLLSQSQHSHLHQGQGITQPVTLQQQLMKSLTLSIPSQQFLASQGYHLSDREWSNAGGNASSPESEYPRGTLNCSTPDVSVPSSSSYSSGMHFNGFSVSGGKIVETNNLVHQQKQGQALHHLVQSLDFPDNESNKPETTVLSKGLELQAMQDQNIMHIGSVNKSTASSGAVLPALVGLTQVMAPQTHSLSRSINSQLSTLNDVSKQFDQQKHDRNFCSISSFPEVSPGNALVALPLNSGNTTVFSTRTPNSSAAMQNMTFSMAGPPESLSAEQIIRGNPKASSRSTSRDQALGALPSVASQQQNSSNASYGFSPGQISVQYPIQSKPSSKGQLQALPAAAPCDSSMSSSSLLSSQLNRVQQNTSVHVLPSSLPASQLSTPYLPQSSAVLVGNIGLQNTSSPKVQPAYKQFAQVKGQQFYSQAAQSQQNLQHMQTVFSFTQQQQPDHQQATSLSYALKHYSDMVQHSKEVSIPANQMQMPLLVSSFGATSSGAFSQSSPIITFGNYRSVSTSNEALNHATSSRKSVDSPQQCGLNYHISNSTAVSVVSSQATAIGADSALHQYPFTASNALFPASCPPFMCGENVWSGAGSVRKSREALATFLPKQPQRASKKLKGGNVLYNLKTNSVLGGSANQISSLSDSVELKIKARPGTPLPHPDPHAMSSSTPAATLQGSH